MYEVGIIKTQSNVVREGAVSTGKAPNYLNIVQRSVLAYKTNVCFLKIRLDILRFVRNFTSIQLVEIKKYVPLADLANVRAVTLDKFFSLPGLVPFLPATGV
jgi:hypothetical protein